MNSFDPENYGFLGEEFVPVIGMNMDTVGYGAKTARAQQDVQTRLPALTRGILQDIGLTFEQLPFGMSGDGLYVFLPPATDPTRALPGLLSASAARLAEDNERYRDRLQARMSIGFGLIRRGPNGQGLVGGLIIDLSRLVECAPIRDAVREHPDSDLVVLVSDRLHELVTSSGCVPAGFTFSRAEVVMPEKQFAAPAWLWVGPRRQMSAA